MVKAIVVIVKVLMDYFYDSNNVTVGQITEKKTFPLSLFIKRKPTSVTFICRSTLYLI